MTNILFIDQDYFYRYAPVSAAVDAKALWPFVRNAQSMDIVPLLGKSLYDRLCLSIENNAVTADEKELLELLRDTLIWATLRSYLLFGAVKIRGEGPTRQSGDGNAAANLDEIQILRNESKSIFYSNAERVQEYLKANASLFPEWGADQQQSALDNKPDFGIYLPSRKKGCDGTNFFLQ